MAEGGNKFDVFLVHCTDDKPLAIKIKDGLKAKGLHVYAHFDEGGTFDIGKPIVNSIQDAVNMSKIVLILLTPRAIKSRWVSYEILMSLERSNREDTMCCRLCMVGISESEGLQYQTGELKHIPSIFVDFNREGWVDNLLANITEEKRMEDILPCGNVAVGLVFNYFVGFLRQVLPPLKETIQTSEFYMKYKDKMLQMFYILLPSSCVVPEITGGGERGIPLIKKEGSLTINAGHGDKARQYNPTVYSIEVNKEVFLFVGECPAIIETMSKLQKHGFVEIDVALQVERFRVTLEELVQHRDNKVCNNTVNFIIYDDKEKSAQEVIHEELTRERLQKLSLEGVKRPKLSNRYSKRSSPHEEKEEFFASITNAERDPDQELAEGIMEFLTDQGRSFNNGVAGRSTLEILEKSRWNIFILSQVSLADPSFKLQFDAAIKNSIDDNEMQVIPVLVKDMKMEDVSAHYRWVRILSAEDPEYLEKIWNVMNRDPIKMTDMIPAGKVYKGLAWAYILNYLPLALLGKTAEGRGFKERFEDAMLKYKMTCLYIAKIFIIIPKSCSFPPPGSQFAGEDHIGPIEPVVQGFRKYFLQMYRITTSKGEQYCYAREYATPVIAMYEMANTYPFAGLSNEALFDQTKLFTQYVKDEIKRERFKREIGDLESRLWLVNYDDMTEVVRRPGEPRRPVSMVEALEKEIYLCMQTEKPSQPPSQP